MDNLVRFSGGRHGGWRVTRMVAVAGPGLPAAERIDAVEATTLAAAPPPAVWSLHGVGSSVRYTTRAESDALRARQAGLGRPEAVCAALIPIRKSPDWWQMAQDERRAVFEERSGHGAIGLDYLPAVSRRLLHSRDIGEPFDFLTWFEFAPEHEPAFDAMLDRLRRTEEWSFVEREVELRLRREPA